MQQSLFGDDSTNQSPGLPGCSTIYAPKGQAGEYAPLATNPYSGCGHGCLYCYVPRMPNWRKHGKDARRLFDAGAIGRTDFIAKLSKDARRYQAAGIREQVMLSFTTDPYHPGDNHLTRQTLKALHSFDMGFCTLTKGGSRALRDIDLFDPKRDAFASTLTSLDDAFSAKWERNAAPASDRIKTLQEFHSAGIFTWVSLEPTIDTEASKAIIEHCYPFIDLWKIGRANYLKDITTTTDWRGYTLDMLEIADRLSLNVYFKRDLQPYLPEGYFNPLRRKQHWG